MADRSDLTDLEAEAQRAYRVRAESTTAAYLNRYLQFAGSRSIGTANDILEYGAIAGGWSNQMAVFEPVPVAYRSAHDQLRQNLQMLNALCRQAEQVVSEPAFSAFTAELLVQVNATNAAIDQYLLTVGFSTITP